MINARPDPTDVAGRRGDNGRLRLPTLPVAADSASHNELRLKVQEKLIAELDQNANISDLELLRGQIEEMYNAILDAERVVLSRSERARLFDYICAEIMGFGPLDSLLQDDSVTEIMVNGPKRVYIERAGRIQRTDVQFENVTHLMKIIDRIVAPLGRRIDESSPMVDARLPDGSRVNAIIPPLSLVGPVLTIRKFSRSPLTVEDLVRFGTVTREVVDFLRACVEARLNIIVSGGTGSGKTTLLNVLSTFIPEDERIITIENAAELQLKQEHVVTLESRPPNIEGKGEVTIRPLVINALRMRPDRIVVGEVRADEAIDMLQAMNTGHDGSLTTAHSNSPRDTLHRLETMVMMGNLDLPLRAIREQIASAINLVIHTERLRDGSRRVVKISEIQDIDADDIILQDIFTFEQTGMRDGRVLGQLRPTGVKPKCMAKIEAAGLFLPSSIFGIEQPVPRPW
jgi:pilus assembly protein CpaF